MPSMPLQLKDFRFDELFQTQGLLRLDQNFLNYLEIENPNLYSHLLAYRNQQSILNPIQTSDFLIDCAVYVEKFLADFFNINQAVHDSQQKTLSQNPVALFKKHFILRRVKKKLLQPSDATLFFNLTQWLETALENSHLQTNDKELAIALLGNYWLSEPEKHSKEIELLTDWCAQALLTHEGKKLTKHWTSFRIPERLDYNNLIPTVIYKECDYKKLTLTDAELSLRDGFKLTDPRMNAREVQDDAHYCIYCHDHEGDFCSKGFPVKKGDESQGLKKNPLGVVLTGCPLDEKISEMNLLKRDGYTIASLVMVMIDNPMCPATGHRICNDCMKACIYQKQEPVNIPQIETRVLTDVLDLPWGVEIYDLLTRWNPLRQEQWVMKPYNGLKVLIAGMGPAGFTLAHHLLLEGFAVVGFDGLKIERLPENLIKHPIRDFNKLKEDLDERLMAGFGGVAEYGITVRWDKNFLKLIYLSLLRKPHFQVFGSTRFGGTINVDDAWALGFDHFVVAVGAGLPKALPIPGSLAPGMRQANDFLMALQLGNAAKTSSLTNIQVRLPAVVIGGGLTGVDTATEVQAYYICQVEKILYRYEILKQQYTEKTILEKLDNISREVLEEFLTHGIAVRHERIRAEKNNEQPNFIKLIRKWGGVTILYRRSMQESPAYILNHEELKKALEEGVFYLDKIEPTSVERNQYGQTEILICHQRVKNSEGEWVTTSESKKIPARSIFVATGTQPNIAYEFEHRGSFNRLGLQYQHYEDVEGELIIPHEIHHCKTPLFGPFTSYRKEHHRVSLIGDTHPVFHGSVVKAIASGMRTYPKILATLKDKLSNIGSNDEYQTFSSKMQKMFSATILSIIRRSDIVIELTIHAPMAVKHYQTGQFYRLQNYETDAISIENTSLQIEPLALSAVKVNRQEETLTFFIVEQGASSKICATFSVGQPISLMGPTGIRAKISHEKESVLIIGDQSSIPILCSYGSALKAAGNQVIYMGILNNEKELYCQDVIEDASDAIIWITQSGDMINVRRKQDYATRGDIIDNLLHFQKMHPEVSLSNLDRIYIIGNTQLMKRFQHARQSELKDFFVKNPRVYGSVYSTMQCMLKGVCAQCLQWQVDPETGQRTKAVFACSWPEQPLELIDFNNIDERQSQNHLQEVLSNLWVGYLFLKNAVEKI